MRTPPHGPAGITRRPAGRAILGPMRLDGQQARGYREAVTEIRRRLAAVTPEDASGAGRPILYAYGLRHLAELAGVVVETARRRSRLLPLELPAEAVAWALAARGRAELADEVLEVLGYAPRHVRERTRQIPVK